MREKLPLARVERDRVAWEAVEVESYICPGCGSELKIGTRGCPKCSARSRRKRPKAATRRSWEQTSDVDGLDLPDDSFDYQSFVEREFGGKSHRQIGIRWYWWITALLLLILMVLAGGSLL